MDKQYEMRLFSELPKNLRNKLLDLDGKKVDIDDTRILPSSKIFIEISKNPGITPYFVDQNQTFYDFFCMKCKERGTTPDEIYEKLLSVFPE